MKNTHVSAAAASDSIDHDYLNRWLAAWALSLAYMPIFGMMIKMIGS